jgi:hypothetical protein
MANRKAEAEREEGTGAAETDGGVPVTDISPEGHMERLGKLSEDSQERAKALAGDPVEVEFLRAAVYDSEIHEMGSVIEMPALDARNLVHLGTVRYNTAGFAGDEKKSGKKAKPTAAKSKK